MGLSEMLGFDLEDEIMKKVSKMKKEYIKMLMVQTLELVIKKNIISSFFTIKKNFIRRNV